MQTDTRLAWTCKTKKKHMRKSHSPGGVVHFLCIYFSLFYLKCKACKIKVFLLAKDLNMTIYLDTMKTDWGHVHRGSAFNITKLLKELT